MFAPRPPLSLKPCCPAPRTKDIDIIAAISKHLQLCTLLHTDIDQHVFAAEPPEGAELANNEIWKLEKALYGYWETPNLWYQHVVTLLDGMNFNPLLTKPGSNRNCAMNVEPFILVDVDFLLGTHLEIQRLIEHLSRSQIMMPTVGSLGQLDGQHVSLGRAIARTARGYSARAKCEANADDGIPDPAERHETSCILCCSLEVAVQRDRAGKGNL